ncbi:MAG: hypothetical protein ABIO37_07770, partial [Caulobacteraceae bacterium]
LTYNSFGLGAVANINFNAETDGRVNVNLNTGGGVVKGTSNLLTDTFTVAAGHLKTTFGMAGTGSTVFTGNTLNQFANIDKIVGFNVALDVLDLPRAFGHVVNTGVSLDLTDAASVINGVNNALAFGGVTLALGDVYVLESPHNVFYLIQNLSGTNIDGGDFIVQLTGVVGSIDNLAAANFT